MLSDTADLSDNFLQVFTTITQGTVIASIDDIKILISALKEVGNQPLKRQIFTEEDDEHIQSGEKYQDILANQQLL